MLLFASIHLCFFLSSGNRSRTLKVLEELGYAHPTDVDVELLEKICQVMSERAARLAAGGLAAIVKVKNNLLDLTIVFKITLMLEFLENLSYSANK